ncbi:serine/arginine repetitive matrix protein 1 [Ostrinia furnacalis]|uniref:serine/arginine repetitive matrix protein 1 n=1 Tax=Ostrinia furnacalis TaxID=93504 RepID=UPI00103C5966|nr:serine/arginine repetitive matrix protein 1 [Ostrinia furnacalis]
MSSRRNGSVSRAAEAASKNRLHMDRNPQHSRITDPSNPAGRRKEIDNVMKRARQASPGSWDRKLLEVEEKDPNRWRHTGYKQMYIDGSGSVSPRRSRSPRPRRSRSPIAARRSRSPIARRSRSPIARRSRSPIARRSRSPVIRRSRSRSLRRSPRRSPRKSPVRRSPVARRRTRSPRARRPPARPPRPPSPPDPRQSSPSGSSMSSCSDESCSVCSAKNKKPAPPPGKPGKPPRPGSTSPRRAAKRPAPPPAARAVQPTRELLKAREASKRTREEKVLEWQRSQLAARAPPPGAPIPPAHIKREGARRGPARAPRAVSPAAIAAALAGSGSGSDSTPDQQPPRLTLSERFGKMAQWSADRSARLDNMRITRRDATLHVRIERAEDEGDPPAPGERPGLEPAPIGSYPEELLAAAPGGLPSWDDVRVRYDYYKKRGYLRGLTLSDYVKWEEWWYKYQEWLKRERAYERWAEGEVGTVRRERRRRGGRHRRS